MKVSKYLSAGPCSRYRSGRFVRNSYVDILGARRNEVIARFILVQGRLG